MAPKPPTPPSHLSRRAKALWRSVNEEFVLAAHQIELLRRALEAGDRADEARRLIDAEGVCMIDRFGQSRPHPAVAIERDSRIAEARLIRDLALGPLDEEHPRPARIGTSATARAR